MEDLGEKCGVFGVFGHSLDVSRISFFGLFALQHRGQESSGIAASDGKRIVCHKGMGLVSQVFLEENMKELKGHIAIGHNRYSTAGGSHIDHAQPTIVGDWSIALAHNGNLPSTVALEKFLRGKNIETEKLSDSGMIAHAISVLAKEGASIEDAIKEAYPLMTGAFSILVMSKDSLIAI